MNVFFLSALMLLLPPPQLSKGNLIMAVLTRNLLYAQDAILFHLTTSTQIVIIS
jgi:hypothetical protein